MSLSKLKFLVPFTILFILLGMLWGELSSSRSYAYSPGITGEKVPAFSVPLLTEPGFMTNKELRGRVILLNFWASWCSACRAEHDMMMKIKDQYRIPVYGIAFKDKPSDARKWLSEAGSPYTQSAYDQKGTTSVDFGIYATPETFIISPSGDILYKQIGVIDQATWDNTIYPIIKKYQE